MLVFLAANLGLIDTPLRPAMKKMLNVHRPHEPGLDIALGWNIKKGRTNVAFHNGKTNGYYAFAGYDARRKIGVVVLSNSDREIADIAWKIFEYPQNAPVEERLGPPSFPH